MTIEQKLANLEGHAAGLASIQLTPYTYGAECERGYNEGPGTTAFPQSSGLAQTFDPAIIFRIGRAASDEAHAFYNDRRKANASAERGLSCFGPVANFAKSPMWGRAQEGLRGEAPDALTRATLQAYTRGLQNLGPAPLDSRTGKPAVGANDAEHASRPQPDPAVCGPNATVGKRPQILTILKHYVAYDGPEGYGFTFGPHAERFAFDAANLSRRDLHATFLPPFRWGIEAGAVGVMSSYNAIAGVPATANPYTLTSILRDAWGLDDEPTRGYVITDAGATDFVQSQHHYVATQAEAAMAAVDAGVDIELTCCGAPAVFGSLADCVRNGSFPEAAVDKALSRALWSQLRTGAQDPVECDPFAWLNVSSAVGSPAHVALAEEAALEALTLLKDGGYVAGRADPPEGLRAAALPLDLAPAADGAPAVVCVVGPNANQTHAVMGDYHPAGAGRIVTPWEGIREAVASAGATARLVATPGCDDAYCPELDQAALLKDLSDGCTAAIVAVVGTTAWSHKPNVTNACGCPKGTAVEGECCDRYGVNLAGRQDDVIRTALQAGLATGLGRDRVGVVVNAAMQVDIAEFVDGPGAVGFIMHAPFLGQAAGTAIGRVLADETTGRGRLAYTWYDAGPQLDGIPGIRDYARPVHNATYQHHTGRPLFPFGSGVVKFPVSASVISAFPAQIAACDSASASLVVAIGGKYNATTVAQVYVNGSDASPDNPRAVLAGFYKVRDAAAGRSISLGLDTTLLAEPVWSDSASDWAPAIVPGPRRVVIAEDAGFLVGLSRPTFWEGVVQITAPGDKPVFLTDCP